MHSKKWMRNVNIVLVSKFEVNISRRSRSRLEEILKCVFEKASFRRKIGLFWPSKVSAAGFCEHGKELSGFHESN
jgi:hypothetical protein